MSNIKNDEFEEELREYYKLLQENKEYILRIMLDYEHIDINILDDPRNFLQQCKIRAYHYPNIRVLLFPKTIEELEIARIMYSFESARLYIPVLLHTGGIQNIPLEDNNGVMAMARILKRIRQGNVSDIALAFPNTITDLAHFIFELDMAFAMNPGIREYIGWEAGFDLTSDVEKEQYNLCYRELCRMATQKKKEAIAKWSIGLDHDGLNDFFTLSIELAKLCGVEVDDNIIRTGGGRAN